METPVTIQRIIWAALLFATLFYCAIGFMTGQKNEATPFSAELHDVFAQMLYGIAVITFGLAFFMRGFLRDRGRPSQLYNIVSWALFESIAIYGLVLAFIKADWRMIAGPEMLAIVGFVTTFPQTDVA